MKIPQHGLTRRQYLAASGAAALSAGLARPAWALETVRQGYQTNIWGMPTYYLMRSGLLEKRGLKFEEFAVPSGNLTMQQMVARQVDVGTYAGQSLILGNAKGGLSALARALAAELGAKGITSNALSPGFFATETNAPMIATPAGERLRERCPAKRWAEPWEIAGAAVFLASPAAAYVNGHTLTVDGGVSATYLA